MIPRRTDTASQENVADELGRGRLPDGREEHHGGGHGDEAARIMNAESILGHARQDGAGGEGLAAGRAAEGGGAQEAPRHDCQRDRGPSCT